MAEHGVLVVATYPPRSCGIATYAQDIVHGLRGVGTDCKVLSIDDGTYLRPGMPEVWKNMQFDKREAYGRIADEINLASFSCVALQHEFGLFGGPDGEWILDFLQNLLVPVVTTLHTVIPNPSLNQRRIVREIARNSRSLIVLSEISRRLLADVYDISERVLVLPHGVPDVPHLDVEVAKMRFGHGLAGRPTISTFGLISRGKGIEYAIEAVRMVAEAYPSVCYIIGGMTHPKVLEQEGEAYRDELRAQVKQSRIENNVLFIDRFMTLQDLLGLLAATDIYFTPYMNRDQVVSGTLAYALGAGKAILSTPYVYAEELLADSRGLLCDFRDSVGMAEQLLVLLSDEPLRKRIENRAYAFGRKMTWPYLSRQLAQMYMGEAGCEKRVLVLPA